MASRSRILREAIRLFTERGIERVTIEEIAAAAEVGKGTVYNYFDAKEDIVVSFLIELDREALEAMPGLADRAASAAEALDAAAWSLLRNKEAHRDFVKTFLGRVAAADGFAEELGAFQRALDEALRALFSALRTRFGAPQEDVPLEELILSFKTMHLGLSMLWAIEGPPYSNSRAMTRRHMTLLAKGLGA